MPTVSVCIPTYNGARYIGRTLRSVLNQTYLDFEVVIADDGSDDGTLDVVDAIGDRRIRVIVGAGRGGAPANFNRAVDHARGRFVKLLCQDDVLYPECLRQQVAALEAAESDGVVLTTSRRDIVDERDHVLFRARGWRGVDGRVPGATAIRASVRSGTNLLGEPSAALCLRAAVERVGGFSLDQTYMIDLDLWFRLLEDGAALVYIPSALCTFRVSSTSWSADLARRQAFEARALFGAMRARRPDLVSRGDLALGVARSLALARARRAVVGARRMLAAAPARSRVLVADR